MKSSYKLSLGSLSGILSAAGIILGPMLVFSDLARPWSFILGFVFGGLAGMGVVLTISGLLDRRKERSES